MSAEKRETIDFKESGIHLRQNQTSHLLRPRLARMSPAQTQTRQVLALKNDGPQHSALSLKSIQEHKRPHSSEEGEVKDMFPGQQGLWTYQVPSMSPHYCHWSPPHLQASVMQTSHVHQTRLCLAGPAMGLVLIKTRQQEEPQTLQLYEELKGTWKLHTLEAAFFLSSWESVNNSLRRKYVPPTTSNATCLMSLLPCRWHLQKKGGYARAY